MRTKRAAIADVYWVNTQKIYIAFWSNYKKTASSLFLL